MEKVIVFFCLSAIFISCNNAVHQNKATPVSVISTEQFHFTADTSHVKLHNFDFDMTRTYYSDSSFTDGPLICSDDTADVCKLTFKVVKGFWYVRTDEGWQEFYNPNDSLLKLVYFKKRRFILKPVGESLLYNGQELPGLTNEELYVYSSHESILYFHKDFGIVVIGRNESLVRSDFKEKTGRHKQ